ncbi:MAG: hypothetical protein J6X63_06235, partial [Bacteroidales bacterium]|nr:hypothetical protein [Bacteroidales bacterium]
MASRNKKTAKKPFANFSWFYLILILGIFYLLFSNRGYNIREVQWPEVKQMLQEGDVKQVNFVRNDFTGTVTLRQDSFMKYMDKFGGIAPDRSPHFEFMVSSKFDPEATFEEINTSLQPDRQFKVVMENNNTNWGDIIQWIIFGGFFIAMWAMMFRGVGRNLGGGKGGPGGIFNVGRSTGKLADKNTVNV